MPAITRQKIARRNARRNVRGLMIYCSDYHCSHWTAINACLTWSLGFRPDWHDHLSRTKV
jgi:hypothetical protein